MFSINIYLRFGLIALGLLGGILLSSLYGFWYGFPFVLVGIILLVGYFLLGTVQSAAMMMQTGDFDAANQRLNLTKMPQWLFGPQRAYYFMLKGTMSMQTKDFDTAEKHLEKAQEMGLPTDNEKAMVLLQLASIKAQKNNMQGAIALMKKTKDLKVTQSEIKEQIKEFDKALTQNKGQLNMMRQSPRGGYMPGGKRPRPKMR
jgi:tetratricopeptide (TPR) repeat protein